MTDSPAKAPEITVSGSVGIITSILGFLNNIDKGGASGVDTLCVGVAFLAGKSFLTYALGSASLLVKATRLAVDNPALRVTDMFLTSATALSATRDNYDDTPAQSTPTVH